MSVSLLATDVSDFNCQCFLLVILAVSTQGLHFVSEILSKILQKCACFIIKEYIE